MSAGRKNLFEEHAGEEGFEARFRFMWERVKSGKASLSDMAKAFGKNERTIKRNAEYLSSKDYQVNTFAPVEQWADVPELAVLRQRVAIGNKDKKGLNERMSALRRHWETTWNKKPLSLLTEQDFLNAVTAIRAMNRGSWFTQTVALRLLIRHGIAGKQEWLESMLDTVGLKTSSELPPEIKNKEVFKTVLPRIRKRVYILAEQGRDRLVEGKPVTLEEAQEWEALALTKWVTKIRTGNRLKTYELWGTKIADGRSPIHFDNGNFLSWSVTAKREEHWSVTPQTIPPGAVRIMDAHVQRQNLKPGDWFVQMGMERAHDIRRAVFADEGMSDWSFHDFRKAGLTAEKRAGIPLEIACDRNVGWKDVNTAKKFYLAIDALDGIAESNKVTEYLDLA